MLQNITETTKINEFKFTLLNAWVKRPLRTIKNTSETNANCHVKGSWDSKVTQGKLFSNLLLRTQTGLWNVYVSFFGLSINPHRF